MATTAPPPGEIFDAAGHLLDDAVTLRRDLHHHPELGNDLPRTQAAILDALDGLGLDVSTGDSVTSVTADLDGGAGDGPRILLRADMDALPMPEDTDLPFASATGDVMHACGHDTHVAMLVGAARQLVDRRDDFAGSVRFMFQPGEEGHHGARFMIDEGVLDGVDAAFALHIMSNGPSGLLGGRGGPMLASADEIHITVTGKGGHASMPHFTLDPIPVACEIVLALQSMVTRRVDVFDPSVVTVGRISAGTTNNVIPETAEIEGTVRAVSAATRQKVLDGIRRVAEGIASAHDVDVAVDRIEGYPVTVNDPDFAQFAMASARDLRKGQMVLDMPNPVMGAEDFSYVLEDVPGAMLMLGGCPPDLDHATAAPNHSNRMLLDEEAMQTGIATYTTVALDYLAGRAA